MNIVFLSNELMPVVPDPDDERFLVVWTPKRREKDFYAGVLKEISDGGIEALHHYLLELDLGDFNIGTPPPMTKSKERLIDQSKDTVQRFFEDWQTEQTPHPYCACLKPDLYEAYRRWCNREGERFPRSQIQFTSTISKLDDIQATVKPVYKGMEKALVQSPTEESRKTSPTRIYLVDADADVSQNPIEDRTRMIVEFNKSLHGGGFDD